MPIEQDEEFIFDENPEAEYDDEGNVSGLNDDDGLGFFEDEDNDVEEQVEAGEEAAEVEDADFPIPVTYTNSRGETITKEVKYSQLSDLMKFSEDAVVQLEQFVAAQQTLSAWEKDPVMRQINAYRKQGYDEVQILKGLLIAAEGGVQKEESVPEFDNVADEIKWHTQNELKKEREALRKSQEATDRKLQEIESNEAMKSIAVYNDNSWASAFTELGHSLDLTPEVKNKVTTVINKYWPGLDVTQQRISPDQARLIVKEALGDGAAQRATPAAAKSKAQQMAQQANRMKGAPKVLPNVPSKGRTPVEEPKPEYATKADRKARFKNML